MIETTIQGHQVRLLATRQAPGVLLDTWEDLGQPRDSSRRTGVVVTFRKGHDLLDGNTGLTDPFVPSDIYAMGYDDQPSRDPAERFEEALRQERERARDRLGGPLRFNGVGP